MAVLTYVSDTQLTFALPSITAAPGSVIVILTDTNPGGGIASSQLTITTKTISANAAARFLQQASWAPTPALIAHVQQVGFEGYLNEQFNSSEDSYSDPDFQWVAAHFLQAAAEHEDTQLRTKAGWAFYKLFNAPGSTVTGAVSSVPNLANRDAFGSYKNLLTDLSLNVENGVFLSYCCWDPIDLPSGQQPDENFARELLQLFSVGPYALNEDATPQLDNNGAPLPAYSLADIRAIARSVTGLTYNQAAFWSSADPEGLVPMTSDVSSHHDSNAKSLLGQTIPSGMDAQSEVKFVVAQLAANPNTGRHLSSYLIHEFITSNPSPDYVKRISAVWADDGHGNNGNLRAVLKAILLDPEARAGDDTDGSSDYDFGRMRDPVNFSTTIIREFNAQPMPGVPLWGPEISFTTAAHEQVFSAQSVFGYYSDYYGLGQTHLLAPESQIYLSDGIKQRAQFVAYVFGMPDFPNPVPSSVNWAKWLPLAAGDGSALVDQLNLLCFHGKMSPDLRSILLQNAQSISSSDLLTRVQQASYLAVMAPEFAVER